METSFWRQTNQLWFLMFSIFHLLELYDAIISRKSYCLQYKWICFFNLYDVHYKRRIRISLPDSWADSISCYRSLCDEVPLLLNHEFIGNASIPLGQEYFISYENICYLIIYYNTKRSSVVSFFGDESRRPYPFKSLNNFKLFQIKSIKSTLNWVYILFTLRPVGELVYL